MLALALPPDIANLRLFTDHQLQSEFDAASEYVRVLSVVLDERCLLHEHQEQHLQELIQPAPPFVSHSGSCNAFLDLIEAVVCQIGPRPPNNIDWSLVANASPVFAEFGIGPTQLELVWDALIRDSFESSISQDIIDACLARVHLAHHELCVFYGLKDGRQTKNGQVHPRFFVTDQIMARLVNAEPAKDPTSIISSIRALMKHTRIVNDFDAFFDDSLSQTVSTWKTRWGYVATRIRDRPEEWAPVRDALFGTDEVERNRRLARISDYLTSFNKTVKPTVDSEQAFTPLEEKMWEALKASFAVVTLNTLRQTINAHSSSWIHDPTSSSSSSSSVSGNNLRELLLLRMCFIDNYYGVPRRTADYMWLTFDMPDADDPPSNYIVLGPENLAVYNNYKTFATYGQYSHLLSHDSVQLIHAIRAIYPHSKFILWDGSVAMGQKSMLKLLCLAWSRFILSEQGIAVDANIHYNFLRKLAVTCMSDAGQLKYQSERDNVARAMGNSAAIQQTAYVPKAVLPPAPVFNPFLSS
ncbi:hypothetical protein HDU81_010872 [Chytriomyces hyalinus]|nr:hypothetical protein HDU81_010872 [Chytriomyces hyalinus]